MNVMDATSGLRQAATHSSIGVMLATYNGERFVGEQIDSILGQLAVTTTLYIRDDGSTDGTRSILRDYAKAYPEQVVLLPDAPRRFGAACENFLSMVVELHGASHSYFAFSDQDDIWLPEKLSRAIQQLTLTKASGYASNLTAFSTVPNAEWIIEKAFPQRPLDHLFQSASAGCTYVFESAAAALIASRVGQLETHDWNGMSHDWLCYAICRSHGLSWVIDKWSGIRYRQHAQNQFGAMPGVKGAVKRLELMRRGWYRDVLLRNRRFLNAANIEEQWIFDRIARFDVTDRLWLAAHVHKFRREPKAQIGLAAALIAGII